MLSFTNYQHDMLEERKQQPLKNEKNVKILSHAEAKQLQDAVRAKYRKAFDALKDK